MESIWMNETIPPRQPLRQSVRTDVLVIGGGMAGILCAWQLQQAGIDCIVAEADAIGLGVTRNTTAKITSQHGLCYHKIFETYGPQAAGTYLQANEQAVAAYRTLGKSIDCDYREEINYIYSLDDPALLETELEVLNYLGFPAEFRRDLPLPFPTAGAVAFPRQGQFHVRKFLSAISEGLTICEHTPVRELTKFGAVTDHGFIHAESIIVATHFPFLNKHGSYFLKLYQQRSYVLALENVPKFDGMYLDEQENGLSFRWHGDTLLLGGGGHRTGKNGGGWQVLEDFARRHFPGAVISHRWATQDCMSLDGIPYIGQYSPRTPGLYVATGFNKWGMTGSMVAAQILCQQIQGKSHPCQEIFDPARSILHPQLGMNILESTKNLLTPTAPRCPHLGCALKWNRQEHSWDCPCHGSRFTQGGRLIDNPATGDLPKPPKRKGSRFFP